VRLSEFSARVPLPDRGGVRQDAAFWQAPRPDVRRSARPVQPRERQDGPVLRAVRSAFRASARPRQDAAVDKSAVQGRSPGQSSPAARPALADGVRPLPARPAGQDAVQALQAAAPAGLLHLGEMTAPAAAAAPVLPEPPACPRPSDEAALRRPASAAAAAAPVPHAEPAARGVPANAEESSEYRVGQVQLQAQPGPRASAAEPQAVPPAWPGAQSAPAQPQHPPRRSSEFLLEEDARPAV
jgi:hypothetical protein